MSTATAIGKVGQPDHMRNYVAGQLKSGVDQETIVAELGKSGIQENVARQLVESVSQAPPSAPIQPTSASSPVQGAIIGGLIASVLGGLIWAGLVILTGFEFGIVAWGLGVVVGWAVVMFSKEGRGLPQQVAGVTFSIFGILIGKYVAFYYFFSEVLGQELGAEAAESISMFSLATIIAFLASLGEMVGIFDLLWIFLAVGSAWKITSPSE